MMDPLNFHSIDVRIHVVLLHDPYNFHVVFVHSLLYFLTQLAQVLCKVHAMFKIVSVVFHALTVLMQFLCTIHALYVQFFEFTTTCVPY